MNATDDLKKRRKDLLEWLCANPLHPDFEEKHREFNNVVLKLDFQQCRPDKNALMKHSKEFSYHPIYQ